MNPLGYTIAEACACAPIGRTSLYHAINAGELRAVKRGKRTIILHDDLVRYLRSLPAIKAKQLDAAAPAGSMKDTDGDAREMPSAGKHRLTS